jgi:flagellar hook-basal body complex protein FliE
MKVGQMLTLLPAVEQQTKKTVAAVLKETHATFGETLKQAVNDVSALQSEAGKAVERMVAGEAVDLHEVMIAVEKAKTSFELLMEIRNKTLDMYREIMRMQV